MPEKKQSTYILKWCQSGLTQAVSHCFMLTALRVLICRRHLQPELSDWGRHLLMVPQRLALSNSDLQLRSMLSWRQLWLTIKMTNMLWAVEQYTLWLQQFVCFTCNCFTVQFIRSSVRAAVVLSRARLCVWGFMERRLYIRWLSWLKAAYSYRRSNQGNGAFPTVWCEGFQEPDRQ